MIQEKTRGNLTSEEATVLRNAISNLQMAYVEVAEHVSKGGAPPPPAAEREQPTQQQTTSPAEEKPQSTGPISTPPSSESESKKKFTKSYGSWL